MTDGAGERRNPLGQPVGAALPGWTARARPPRTPLAGRCCRLEPLEPDRHAADLAAANALDDEGRMWTYLPYGPFASDESYRAWMGSVATGEDPQFHAILGGSGEDQAGRALGVAAFMRIEPAAGVVEIGHIALSPALQRTAAATEAMALMLGRAFDELGYRRVEWKCDALNAPSRAAALRLGFQYEGLFRQATVTKGRNRDTAWYAIVDSDWPALRAAFARWLDPANFDAAGRQRLRLSDLTRKA
jgi:RimJ/RimL family protein N-acetyltransferase